MLNQHKGTASQLKELKGKLLCQSVVVANKCIFEVAVFELYPKGGEPQTEWVYTPKDSPNWLSVLPQDFSNMAAVQQGMKSAGFPGTMPNPYRERSTVNLHYQLSKYMGVGEPREL